MSNRYFVFDSKLREVPEGPMDNLPVLTSRESKPSDSYQRRQSLEQNASLPTKLSGLDNTLVLLVLLAKNDRNHP